MSEMSSFRELVEMLSTLSEKDEALCPICDENPCVCDSKEKHPDSEPHKEDDLEENVSAQVMAREFSEPQTLPNALRVFTKLKGGNAESLNNEDRLEAAKILKMLIPTISEDDLFSRIKNDIADREKIAHDDEIKGQKENPEASPEAEVEQQ